MIRNVSASHLVAETNVFLVWVKYSSPVYKMDPVGINDEQEWDLSKCIPS